MFLNFSWTCISFTPNFLYSVYLPQRILLDFPFVTSLASCNFKVVNIDHHKHWNTIVLQFMISQANDFDHISCNYDTIYSEKCLSSNCCVDISIQTWLKNECIRRIHWRKLSSSFFLEKECLYSRLKKIFASKRYFVMSPIKHNICRLNWTVNL